MKGLFETVTWATGKSAAASVVSNLGVTLMTLVAEATTAHPRPEDLGEQTTHKKKGDGLHGTNTTKRTYQMTEWTNKPREESEPGDRSGT